MKSLRQAMRAMLLRKSVRRRKVSRGQALLEFALFVPLLMFMVVGATDVSTLLDDHLNIVYAARAGARVGSVIGNYAPGGSTDFTADCAVIGAVQAALTNSPNVVVGQIAIYKAPSNGVYSSSLPQDIYPGNAVCGSGGQPSPGASQTGWIPSSRSTAPFNEDSIGVAISYTYNVQFSPLGGTTFKSTDYAVMPIEIVIGTPPASTPPPTPVP